MLLRLCDHIVIWAVQGLVRAAAAGRHPLDQGQLLRLAACRDTLNEALAVCSGRGDDSNAPEGGGGGGGGMYERRLGFLDDLIQLLTVRDIELDGETHLTKKISPCGLRFFFSCLRCLRDWRHI